MRMRVGQCIVIVLLCASCASTGGDGAQERAARLTAAKKQGAELLARGDFRGAVDALAPLAEEASGDAQIFVMLGEAWEALGDDAKAVHNYERAIRLSYSSPDAHLKLATLLMRQEKIGRALTEFELAIEYGDRDAMTHYNYGLALRSMGRSAEALEHWKRARDLDPENPRFAEAVAIGLTPSDPREALQLFAAAEELGASGASFDNNYGLALEEAGRLREAERRFRAATVQDPGAEDFRFNLAAVTMRQGRYNDAATEWRDMLQRFGEHWSYRVYLARALEEMGQHREAVDAVAKMADDFESGRITETDSVVDRVPPGLDEAFAVLALAWRGLGDRERALVYIGKAVDLSPRNPSHLNNYGVLLAESGMLAEAESQWRRVLEIDPDNVTARENLSAFRR